MKKPKPKCESLLDFLRGNLGKRCLAPLTGTDARALAAAVHIVELYACDRNPDILKCFGEVVLRMQRSTRWFAYHAIAHSIEWTDRAPVWSLAGLGEPPDCPRCAFEPGGPCVSPP